MYQEHDVPCQHTIAIILARRENINEHVSERWSAAYYDSLYSEPIHPVVPQDLEMDALLPPFVFRPRGRPKTKRIRSRGENMSLAEDGCLTSTKKARVCGRCGELSTHNKRTYTARNM